MELQVRNSHFVLLLTVTALASVIFTNRAYAQSIAPKSTEPQSSEQDGVIEVVVTAQRRSQRLQEAPVAVTALSPEVLSDRNISTTQDLMQVAPGLQVSTQTAGNGSGSATFFLRGLGQQRAANGSEPAVGIYIDDIYYPALQGTVFDIVDLQQVEVLRGPQGTLFGRNTIAGAIRYTTKSPSKDFEGSVTATYGSFNRLDIQSIVNLPLSSNIAVRLTAGHLHRDGFVKRADGTPDAGDTTTDLIRGQLRLSPASNLTIDLNAQYSRDKLEGFPYNVPGPISPRAGTVPATYNSTPAGIANPYDNRFVSQCGLCQPGPGFREYNRNRVLSGGASVEWDLDSRTTLKSLTGYNRISSRGGVDYDASIRNIFAAYQGTFYSSFSQELQISSRQIDGRLTLVSGLFYYNEKSRLPDNIVYEQVVLGNVVPAQPVTRYIDSYAAYVDADFELTQKFTLIAGLRFSRDDKRAVASTNTGGLIADQSKVFPSTTGRLGLKYQLTDRAMIYATISEGFRAGGFNYVPTSLGLPGQIFTFEPEKLRSYESGVRLELFDRKLRFNPTFFYTQYSDIQLQSVQLVGTTNFTRLDNAGRAHTYGLELESELALSNEFTLFGSLAALRARYDDIGNATGITIDSKFQRAPELTYSVGSTYRKQLSALTVKGTINYSWQASQASTPTDKDAIILPSYGLLNARIDLSDPSEKYTLSLFATNLTDAIYYVGGVDFGANVGTARRDLGRPREFGATFRVRF